MRHKSSVDPQSLGLQSHTACKTLIWIHPTQQSSPDRPSSPLCWLCRRKSPGKCRKLFFFFSLFFIKVGQAVTTRLLADSDPCSFLDYFSLRFEGKERRQSVVVARSSPWDRPVPKRRAFFSQVGTLSISGWKSERSFPRVTPRSVKKKTSLLSLKKNPSVNRKIYIGLDWRGESSPLEGEIRLYWGRQLWKVPGAPGSVRYNMQQW